jgi:hypothetical protein
MDRSAWEEETLALKRTNQRLLERIAALEATTGQPDHTSLVELDLFNQAVRLRRGAIDEWEHERWVDLFALLYIKAQPGAHRGLLFASELHTVGFWSAIKEASVGKQVTRFLAKLKGAGLDGLIESRGKDTESWQLGSAVIVQCALDPSEVAQHLESRGWAGSSLPSFVSLTDFAQWVATATRALMDLQAGEVERAQETAAALAVATKDPLLSKIARLLAIRAIQRAGTTRDKGDVDLGEFDHLAAWGVGPVARGLHARAVAMQRYWSRPPYGDQIDEIARLAVAAEASGDLGAAASLHGTLAVLNRRDGNLRASEAALRRAIPLFIANGDVLNLQGSVFNLGHLIERLVRRDGSLDYDLALSMLDLDRDMRRQFRLGIDSAQGEILMALIRAERDPLDAAADELLKQAEEIIGRNQSAFDEACWHRAHAKLLHRRAEKNGRLGDPEVIHKIADRLERAIEWFADSERDAIATQHKLNNLRALGRAWPATE